MYDYDKVELANMNRYALFPLEKAFLHSAVSGAIQGAGGERNSTSNQP